eukprot:TRINITY_DN2131_c0_g1_i4.p1 TRINITY_DN2131_c0_g1~~TRINITY_DN2131_c0_g1_i4.p1  ORF type:complete len:136 (+),score=11.82 TRINITY_DN2131_c0_g1_i4:84-491(+)
MRFLTLGGGCFWCVEASVKLLPGVVATWPGYAGGDPALANYKSVCSGTTGHAEVVRVAYEDTAGGEVLSRLLTLFFRVHDPTTPNRQGNDVGTQYRSAIFYDAPGMAVAVRAGSGSGWVAVLPVDRGDQCGSNGV